MTHGRKRDKCALIVSSCDVTSTGRATLHIFLPLHLAKWISNATLGAHTGLTLLSQTHWSTTYFFTVPSPGGESEFWEAVESWCGRRFSEPQLCLSPLFKKYTHGVAGSVLCSDSHRCAGGVLVSCFRQKFLLSKCRTQQYENWWSKYYSMQKLIILAGTCPFDNYLVYELMVFCLFFSITWLLRLHLFGLCFTVLQLRSEALCILFLQCKFAYMS